MVDIDTHDDGPTGGSGGRFPTTGPDSVGLDRYRVVPTGDGEVILFDDERETAWIQSEGAVSLEEWR